MDLRKVYLYLVFESQFQKTKDGGYEYNFGKQAIEEDYTIEGFLIPLPFFNPVGKYVIRKLGKGIEILEAGSKRIICKIFQRACFIEGTLVLTVYGNTPIESIKAGELIWIKDENICVQNINTEESCIDLENNQYSINYFQNPYCLLDRWENTPLSLIWYSESELEIQKRINEQEVGIVTYAPFYQTDEYIDIDYEEITPSTWKWVKLELEKADGTLSKISVRRPNWWIVESNANKVGNRVFLSMPEMGIEGEAVVTEITPNQLDTRLWNENRQGDYVNRPITGKFEHISSDVSNYYFEELEQPIGATSSHPFWSVDRQDWIAVGDLEIGERVKTKVGTSVLLSKDKLEGEHKVFNLEVYREHNFLVSESGVLVHNTYWQQRLKKFMEYADNIDASKLTSQDETIQHLENVFRALDKTRNR